MFIPQHVTITHDEAAQFYLYPYQPAHLSVLCTGHLPLQHNQFVLISAPIYHPQAKLPQSKVEFA